MEMKETHTCKILKGIPVYFGEMARFGQLELRRSGIAQRGSSQFPFQCLPLW